MNQLNCINTISSEINKLQELLKNLGLSKDDDIFVISNIAAIGLPPCFDKVDRSIIQFYYDVIQSVVADGTICFITYSFDFVRTKYFDYDKTPTKHGVLNEFMRTLPSSIRSLHPFGSCAAIGKRAEYYMGDCSSSCFGFDSPFDRMIKNNVKCLVLGKNPGHVPIYHTVEQSVGVPYNYNKILKGEVIYQGEKIDKIFTAFLRFKYLDIKYDLAKIYKGFEENVEHKSADYLRSKFTVSYIQDYYNWILLKYLEDYHYFLEYLPNYKPDNLPFI